MTTATIKIWDETVGAVTWRSDRNYAVFEYDPSFVKKGLDLAPIYVSINDARPGTTFYFPNLDTHTFRGLPGLLAQSLPDDFGNKVIDSWLVEQGRSLNSFNPVERLCYIGTRGMGALEYFPSIAPSSLNKSVPVDVQRLMDLANKVLDDRKRLNVHLKGPDSQKESAMRDILRVGVSAGGAVPKAIIAINEDNHIISGQADIPEGYSHWIIKFDGINQDRFQLGKSNDNGRVEYAYYLMAKEAGIDMPECRLLEENGRSHFMIRRFDREHNRKFHTLSLSCMGHYGWNPIGSSSYEMAFQIMRALSLPYPEQEEQYRRMVFNAVARNVDDHVKNISYVMDRDGTWHLSPAYDVTFSVNPEDALGEMHKISLNGKRDDFTYEDFIEVAENTGINNAEDIIEEVLDVVSEWHEFAIESRVSPEIIKYVGNQHIDKQQLDNRSSMSPRP